MAILSGDITVVGEGGGFVTLIARNYKIPQELRPLLENVMQLLAGVVKHARDV